jgi:hypothetical protein
MKRFSEKAVAAAAFLTALGGSLLVLPMAFDNPAFALDAKGGTGEQPGWHHRMPSEMIEARLAYAKTALKITDAQTKQWNAVADVLRKQAKEKDAEFETMRANHEKGEQMSVIDRMEMRQKMMVTHAASLSELIAAAKPLYASLSDEQKKTADELLKPHWGGPGGMHGPHGWEHGGPGGHGPEGAPPPR